ncbi:MAG: hypothetical protein ACX939_13455, partial [Hyphococcus sp.]
GDLDALQGRERETLRLAAECSGIRDHGLSLMNATALKTLAKVESAIAAQEDLASLRKYLKRIREDKEVASVPGLQTGIEIGLEMLEHGENSIYSPDFYEGVLVFSKKKSAGEHAKDVGKSDVSGAVGGAAGGATAGASTATPFGVAAGAVAGALTMGVGSSVKQVVSKIIDWLTS